MKNFHHFMYIIIYTFPPRWYADTRLYCIVLFASGIEEKNQIENQSHQYSCVCWKCWDWKQVTNDNKNTYNLSITRKNNKRISATLTNSKKSMEEHFNGNWGRTNFNTLKFKKQGFDLFLILLIGFFLFFFHYFI